MISKRSKTIVVGEEKDGFFRTRVIMYDDEIVIRQRIHDGTVVARVVLDLDEAEDVEDLLREWVEERYHIK